jgi:hypothetical protein
MKNLKNKPLRVLMAIVALASLALIPFSAKAVDPEFVKQAHISNYVLPGAPGATLTATNMNTSPFQIGYSGLALASNIVAIQIKSSAANTGTSNLVVGVKTTLDYTALGYADQIYWYTNTLSGTNPVNNIFYLNTGLARQCGVVTNWTTQTNPVTFTVEFGQFQFPHQ